MTARPILFDALPRTKRRVLMHVTDAGAGNVHLVCGTCGHDNGWTEENVREAKRGIPCPKCNP